MADPEPAPAADPELPPAARRKPPPAADPEPTPPPPLLRPTHPRSRRALALLVARRAPGRPVTRLLLGSPGLPTTHDWSGLPAVAGTVNLTMPLSTWLGFQDAPGEVSGFGPLTADDSRYLGTAMADHPQTRWCVTLTGEDGRPVAHGCARQGHGPPPAAPGPAASAYGPARPAHARESPVHGPAPPDHGPGLPSVPASTSGPAIGTAPSRRPHLDHPEWAQLQHPPGRLPRLGSSLPAPLRRPSPRSPVPSLRAGWRRDT